MTESLINHLHARRLARGWSQAELAQRAGISRAAVSAIEMNRLAPSVVAALALASALECTVEAIFSTTPRPAVGTSWAWLPAAWPARYWSAEVHDRTLLFPVQRGPSGVVAHDGVAASHDEIIVSPGQARQTLVLACCDPAASLLVAEYQRTTAFRLLVLSRTSREALQLLDDRMVHVAGVHLSRSNERGGNTAAIRAAGISHELDLVRIAQWQEGIVYRPELRLNSARAAVKSKLRWIGREEGSGARRCLDEVLAGHAPPKRLATDHRGVADAIRQGWADAGVCVRLASEECQLSFLPVCEENYDLCYPHHLADDPRMKALLEVVRSSNYRRLLGELPGYRLHETGDVERVHSNINR